jgi:hypothetical protein
MLFQTSEELKLNWDCQISFCSGFLLHPIPVWFWCYISVQTPLTQHPISLPFPLERHLTSLDLHFLVAHGLTVIWFLTTAVDLQTIFDGILGFKCSINTLLSFEYLKIYCEDSIILVDIGLRKGKWVSDSLACSHPQLQQLITSSSDRRGTCRWLMNTHCQWCQPLSKLLMSGGKEPSLGPKVDEDIRLSVCHLLCLSRCFIEGNPAFNILFENTFSISCIKNHGSGIYLSNWFHFSLLLRLPYICLWLAASNLACTGSCFLMMKIIIFPSFECRVDLVACF